MSPVDRHIETVTIPGRRLGLRLSDLSKQRLRLRLTGTIPAHPATADHFSKITNWGMLGNDKWGDCGPAAVAHYTMLVTAYLTGTMVSPSLNDVLALYTLCNPTFNPNTGAGDNGVDMGEMLGFVCTNGISGKKALAHATVSVSSPDDIRAVVSIFGGALLGVVLETAQQAQTNTGLWDYSPSATWGGHAVLAGLYTSNAAAGASDISVVTWGQVCGTTDAFEQRQLQECHVLIFPEHLGTVAFQQGVDVAALAADYEALTGQPFPVAPGPAPTPPPPAPPGPSPVPPTPPTPTPTPGPCVDTADQALAPVLHTLISQPRRWWSRTDAAVVTAAQAWLAAKQL